MQENDERKASFLYAMSFNRHERRRIGMASRGIKIPASNKPYIKPLN